MIEVTRYNSNLVIERKYSERRYGLDVELVGGRLMAQNNMVTSILGYLGFTWVDYDIMRDIEIFAKNPHIYRIIKRFIRIYWKILSLIWEVGLIDTGMGEEFRWADFYRIKSH